MANNRMLLVCNTCIPDGTPFSEFWQNRPDGAIRYRDGICVIGKWYPGMSYAAYSDQVLGEDINRFLSDHAHIGGKFEEWPVRLTYELNRGE